MAEEQDQKQLKQQKKEKAKVIPIEEIGYINDRNQEEISLLETDHATYSIEQGERDKDWVNIEININDKLNLLKSEITSMNEELRKLKENFSILTKNFKNYVKKTEIDYVKVKLDSIKFEELATKQELDKIKTSQ